MLRTYSAKQNEVPYRWHVIDATDRPLGRLATEIARLLMGKHKPQYTRHVLTGDFVIVVNASRLYVSGQKAKQQMYYRHSGYIGHLRETPLEVMLARHPDRVIELAVKGMLPKNTLARQMLRRLKVYSGETHPHEAQVKAGEIIPTPRVKKRRSSVSPKPIIAQPAAAASAVESSEDAPKPVRRRRSATASAVESSEDAPKPARRRRSAAADSSEKDD